MTTKSQFYVLRYLPEVKLKHRLHAPTLGRFTTLGAADDARLRGPVAHLLEVVLRGGEAT